MTKQERAKDLRLQREYHTTLAEWNKVYEYQKKCCFICKRIYNKKGKKLVLSTDHCHTTGLVRGLLCMECNKAISKFRDNLDRFRNAVLYFEHNPYTEALGYQTFTAPGRIGTAVRKKALAAFNAARKKNGASQERQKGGKSRKK